MKPRRYTGPVKKVHDLVVKRATVDDVPLCEVCGLIPGTQIHHRQPRALGGSKRPEINQPANLLWVCGYGSSSGCHRLIESNRDHACSMGWLVRHPLAPSAMPVCRRSVWVWLRDDSAVIPASLEEIATWIGGDAA